MASPGQSGGRPVRVLAAAVLAAVAARCLLLLLRSLRATAFAVKIANQPADAVTTTTSGPAAVAAASPFCPPSSEQHSSFVTLVDTSIKAALLQRHQRAADFCGLAAEAGGPLFGDESLLVADLRVREALSLHRQAVEERTARGAAGAADAEALDRRAWAVLLSHALSPIKSRIDAGTLLPGTLRAVEEAYVEYKWQAVARVTQQLAPGPAAPGAAAADLGHHYCLDAPAFGYEAALLAARAALSLLPLQHWHGDEKERAQACVLAALRLIPGTAAVAHATPGEHGLVDVVERSVTPTRHGDDFCASVLALWRSPALADVLRARGSLQGAAAAVAAFDAECEARQQADLAKKGLRSCALPPCGKQETTVLQFRVCGHCKTTRYCCRAHAKLHWPAHRRETAAEEEEDEQEGEASGGGGAEA